MPHATASASVTASLIEDTRSWWAAFTDPVQRAARKFMKERADYYDTLADRMQNARGITLKEMLERDAERYGHAEDGRAVDTPRGVLSAYWAQRYVDVGGDLGRLFASDEPGQPGTLPAEDVTVIRIAQQAGAGALPSTLRDLARLTELISRAKSTFVSTTTMGVAALLIFVGFLLSIPFGSAPMLRQTFGAIPAEQLPDTARRFYAFADLLSANIVLVVLLLVGAVWLVRWSLPNLVGPRRTALDRYLIWRLYRDFKGALFLAVLSTIVKQRTDSGTRLSEALQQLQEGAEPYVAWHLERMLQNLANLQTDSVNNSVAIAQCLDTGLIDRETFWYFLDVQEGRGLSEGLQQAGARIESGTLKKIAARAAAVRIGMIVAALVGIVATAGWQISVTRALVDALKNYFTG